MPQSRLTVPDIDPEDVTATTTLPDLPPNPYTPPPPRPKEPVQTTLTAGQRNALAGMVGEEWTVAVDATVAAFDTEVDADGVERGVLLLDFADGAVTKDGRLRQTITPPRSAEDVAAEEEAWTAELAAWEADVEAHNAHQADWERLAGLHNARNAARAAEAQAEELRQLEADVARRFADAVDQRVVAKLAELGVTPAAGKPAR